MTTTARDKFSYKVELHIHLDGAIRSETVLDISKTKDRPIISTDEDGKQTIITDQETLDKEIVIKTPCSLKAFLHTFNVFMPIIAGDRDAVFRIAYEFCEDCANSGIRYVEVRYNPHLLSNSLEKPDYALTRGDFSPRDVVATVCDALEKGSIDFNLTVNSILCCMTHKPEWSAEIVDLCKEFKHRGVVAIDSAGQDFIPGKDPQLCSHKIAFKKAYDNGIHRTVHAGENGPSEGVREALDHMYAERIGHGYHVTDDPDLYNRCKKDCVHFEICPASSIITGACPVDIQKHPLIRFANEGLNFSLNTDDPIILDNMLADDYLMAGQMGLSDEQIIKSIFNAARASFATVEQRKKLLADLVDVYGEH
ncbi:adenosine deaminase-like [Mizuhopecten yessoensis]|uniref:Adenosine deaminase n=1 Tax=Mizuhopecten yessoensis TaxID=6573 RepID=A0A210QKP7_MIZYE|nr:adenosine deaminase-like [Mizuhopecten yessoensis]OWF49310.1 Adenosine deaminase [Mizuhopecten yessoensis]